MKYQNTHSIRGYVGQDANTTKFENDRQVTNFSVATKTFWKENGEDKSRTEWHRVVVWGNLSKKVAENLKKGQPVLVEGESRTREYTKQVDTGKKESIRFRGVNQITRSESISASLGTRDEMRENPNIFLSAEAG